MENKTLLFGALLVVALLIFGCTGTTEQEIVEKEDTEAQKEVPISEQEVEEMIEQITEAPVYEAPLTGSIDKTCEIDSDCRLVKYRTGIGIIEDCMGKNSDYEGLAKNCVCKNIGQTSQVLVNGTELSVQINECRNI